MLARQIVTSNYYPTTAPAARWNSELFSLPFKYLSATPLLPYPRLSRHRRRHHNNATTSCDALNSSRGLNMDKNTDELLRRPLYGTALSLAYSRPTLRNVLPRHR